MSAKEQLDKLVTHINENLKSEKEPLFKPEQLVELAESDSTLRSFHENILCQLLEAFIEKPKAFDYILDQLYLSTLSYQLVRSFGCFEKHSFGALLIELAKRESSDCFDKAFDLAKKEDFTDIPKDPSSFDKTGDDFADILKALHDAGHTASHKKVFDYIQEQNLFTSFLYPEPFYFIDFLKALTPDQQKIVYFNPEIKEGIRSLLMSPNNSSYKNFISSLAMPLSNNPESLKDAIDFVLDNIQTCLTPLTKDYKGKFNDNTGLLCLLKALAPSDQFKRVFDALIDKVPSFMKTLGEIVILGEPTGRRSFAEK